MDHIGQVACAARRTPRHLPLRQPARLHQRQELLSERRPCARPAQQHQPFLPRQALMIRQIQQAQHVGLVDLRQQQQNAHRWLAHAVRPLLEVAQHRTGQAGVCVQVVILAGGSAIDPLGCVLRCPPPGQPVRFTRAHWISARHLGRDLVKAEPEAVHPLSQPVQLGLESLPPGRYRQHSLGPVPVVRAIACPAVMTACPVPCRRAGMSNDSRPCLLRRTDSERRGQNKLLTHAGWAAETRRPPCAPAAAAGLSQQRTAAR